MLLDDRPDQRDLLATLLHYAGHSVLEAANGEAALELAREYRPDLVITDIVMPAMNGYEFVRRLRSEPEVGATTVIFCTANYLETEVRGLAEACGVSRFISKPCAPDVVLETVAEALDAPREPLPAPPVPGPEFEREQLRLVNDKLVEKVAELERANTHRQRLLALVMGAREEERCRIADDIHDDSLQAIGAVGLRLELLQRRLDDPETVATVERLRRTVSDAGERLRHLLFELRPPELDYHGLGAALTAYLEHATRDEGVSFTVEDALERDPDADTQAFLYRLALEVLGNARKHAQASHIDVRTEAREGGYSVRVADDGVGFAVEAALRAVPGHLGLAALKERVELAGGSLRIESKPAAGAVVELWVPAGGARQGVDGGVGAWRDAGER